MKMDRKLIRPKSMDEALGERAKYGRDGLPIAGGQSLLVLLRNKLIDPQILIDLENVTDLYGLKGASGRVIDRRNDDHPCSFVVWGRTDRSGGSWPSGIQGRIYGNPKPRNDRR